MNHFNNINIESSDFDTIDLPENIRQVVEEKLAQDPESKVKFNALIEKNISSWDTENAGKFIFLFPENWRKLVINYGLSGLESNVLMLIMEKMQFGNLVQISQAGIASELNTKQPSISRVFKSLKEKQVLIEKDKSIYLNPRLASKGNPKTLNEQNKEYFKTAYSAYENNSNFDNVLKTKKGKK